jgi:hypothetical protein
MGSHRFAAAVLMTSLLVAGCGQPPRAPEETPAATTPRPAAAPGPEPDPAPAAPAPARAKSRELQMPQVEGLVQGETQSYGDPRLGHSVTYKSAKNLVVTVYVYDAGQPGIADGISDAARAQFAQAESDIFELSKRGGWLSVARVRDREEVSLGDGPGAVKMLRASFKLGTEKGDALSDLYLTGDRGKFLKIRCTYPAATAKECQEERARLLKALGAAVAATEQP